MVRFGDIHLLFGEENMNKSTLVPSICPYCGVGCGLYISVEEGTLRGLEYQREHPVNEGALCPKGNAALDIVYHHERLQYPQQKTEDGFKRISWDEALDLTAEKISSIRSQYGPNAIGYLSSAKCTNEENYLFQKLARMLGTNNVDHCARL
jgi:formate dehydrogenase (coenzyme F420) alpha subunit